MNSSFVFRFLAVIVVAVGVFAQSCGRKADTPPLTQWSVYDDPYAEVGFSYPTGWHLAVDAGKVTIVTSAEATRKFLDPTAKAPDGAQITISKQKLDKLVTPRQYIDEEIKNLSVSGFKITHNAGKSFAGMDPYEMTYSGKFSADTRLKARKTVAVRDSMLYYIEYAAFNDYYDSYLAAFDSVLASITFERHKPAANVDPSLPSPNFDTFDNFAIRVQYPENFETSIPRPKGGATFSMDIKGYRQDCNIRVDILPSKGLTLDKVVEQNTKFYKSTSKGETKIDGQRAVYLNYTPAGNISSRVYFVVKGDKMARIITNYYSPMKADFTPAFERVIASLKLK